MHNREKIVNWINIEHLTIELPVDGDIVRQFTIEGKKVCFAVYQHSLKAFAATCPHAGGQFAYARRDAAGNIICPLHGYKFNPANGRNISGEGYFLKTYPLERRADGLYIGF